MTENDLFFIMGACALAGCIFGTWVLLLIVEAACGVFRSLKSPPRKPQRDHRIKVSGSKPIPFYPDTTNHWRIG